jgi:hypothetical protein
MAGSLTISTLKNDTGVLATQNGMTGIPKAWVLFNGSTGAIYGTAFNVSSVTRSGTGLYLINFTTAMPDANYSVTTSVGTNTSGGGSVLSSYSNTSGVLAPTTSTVGLTSASRSAGALIDSTYIAAAIFSS